MARLESGMCKYQNVFLYISSLRDIEQIRTIRISSVQKITELDVTSCLLNSRNIKEFTQNQTHIDDLIKETDDNIVSLTIEGTLIHIST